MIETTILKKIWSMLLADECQSAIMLMVLILIGMILEAMGIGLIVPALALITQNDLADKYPALMSWSNSMGNPSHGQLVIAGMLILVSVYAFKAMFLAFLAWKQGQFTYNLQANLSRRLLRGYLHQPYIFHLGRNSAQLIRNTIGQVSGITNVTQQILMLITETMILTGVFILLVYVEPLGAFLSLVIFGLAGWIFNRMSKERLLRWGETRQHHEGFRIQHAQQGFGGVKDVKLLGRESEFIEQYQTHNKGSAQIGARQFTLQALPRLWFELLAVVCLAVLVITMINQEKHLEALLPTIGLFAAAAFRLMPSVGRIHGSIQNIRYLIPVVDNIYSELNLLNETTIDKCDKPLPLENEINIEQVSFQYPSTELQSLDKVNLSIPKGSLVGLVGGSGAGKSTLIDIVLGLFSPSSGSIKVDGIDIQNNIRGWQDQIGYVPQSIYLTDDTLRQNIAFGIPANQVDENAIWKAIHAAQLEQFINELPQGLDTVVGECGIRLSGGQRQRIGIARALYHNPPVLVLDEATSSLDISTERGVMDAVNALHGTKTVIIVAHRLSTVEHCDYLYRLEKGVIVDEGETSKVLNRLTAKEANKN